MKQFAIALAAFLSFCLPSLAVTAANSSLSIVYLSHPVTGLLIQVKHKKNQNEGSEDDSGLSECTIQQQGGGGGCTVGFKRVCEKMKSGEKCCGCVVDKSAKGKTQTTPTTTPSNSTSGTQGSSNGGTLLLPYFKCDLNKPGGCKNLGQ